jgi:nucleotidyltransferase/DNA polymerase involved in DNA repair
MTRIILHLDMDAFYTSVEQRDHPEYQGKPVVVGADPRGGRGRGVVAAASYEARGFGLHSAMPIGRAYRLCPQAIYLPSDMRKYGTVSRRIMEILKGFTDLVEQISIDEAFLDATGSVGLFGGGRELALEIKRRIQAQERLGASIGIAPNKFLAKIASDLEKPDGLVEVAAGQEEAFLSDLPVERLWGVGPRTADELHKLGIYKIRDIARLSLAELAERFGKHGRHLHRLARGVDDRPVEPEHEWKSLGQETTFGEDTDDPQKIRRTLLELAEAVARRLRKQELLAGTVTLKYRDEDFKTETRSMTLPDPTDDAGEIFRVTLRLLGRVKDHDVAGSQGSKVRLLGIYGSKLQDVHASPRQLRLFEPDEKKRRLNESMDSIHQRFGEGGVHRASLMDKKGSWQ